MRVQLLVIIAAMSALTAVGCSQFAPSKSRVILTMQPTQGAARGAGPAEQVTGPAPEEVENARAFVAPAKNGKAAAKNVAAQGATPQAPNAKMAANSPAAPSGSAKGTSFAQPSLTQAKITAPTDAAVNNVGAKGDAALANAQQKGNAFATNTLSKGDVVVTSAQQKANASTAAVTNARAGVPVQANPATPVGMALVAPKQVGKEPQDMTEISNDWIQGNVNGVAVPVFDAELTFDGKWSLFVKDDRSYTEYGQELSGFAPKAKGDSSFSLSGIEKCGEIAFGQLPDGRGEAFAIPENAKCSYDLDIADVKLSKVAKEAPTKSEVVGSATIKFLIKIVGPGLKPSWIGGTVKNVKVRFQRPTAS